MSKGKISVRRELREPDAFVKTTYSVVDYVKKHRKLISIAAIILVTLGVTAIGSFWYISDRDDSARQLLNQAILSIDQQSDTVTDNASAPLKTILTSYNTTVAGPVASYLSANQKYRAGELDAAAQIYQTSKQAKDGHLNDLERLGAASINFQQQKYSEAIAILEKLQTKQSFVNEDLYILLGLSYEKSKQPEKAVATYENMIQLLQNSFFKPWAEERLMVLKNNAKS